MAKHTINILSNSVEYLDYILDEMINSKIIRFYDYHFVKDGNETQITFFYDSRKKEKFFTFLRQHIFQTEKREVGTFEAVAGLCCIFIPIIIFFFIILSI